MKFGCLFHIFLHFQSNVLVGFCDFPQLTLSYLIVLFELFNYLKSHLIAGVLNLIFLFI
jgi:hypothetical protein